MIAGEEDVAPALADHWQEVSAAFRDRDARQLYVDADAITDTLNQRANIRLSSIDQDQPFEFRAQSADLQARILRDWKSGYWIALIRSPAAASGARPKPGS